MQRKWVVAVVVLGGALVPTTAHAGLLTVSAEPTTCTEDGCEFARASFTFTGLGLERNRLTVSRTATGVTFKDTGAPIVAIGDLDGDSAVASCAPALATQITCVVASGVHDDVTADLGAGDDVGVADDGPGGLDLTAILRGSLGNDRLGGGTAQATVDGGLGADTLLPAAGGGGRVEYPTLLDVNVTIDGVANDGATGEGDNVHRGFRDIQLGGGNDRFVGSDLREEVFGNNGADDLSGGGGNDYLEPGLFDDGNQRADGGEGDDRVFGGEGDDHVIGGPGDDFLSPFFGADVVDAGDGDDEVNGFANDNARDEYRCGAGDDLVFVPRIPDPLDVLVDCERQQVV